MFSNTKLKVWVPSKNYSVQSAFALASGVWKKRSDKRLSTVLFLPLLKMNIQILSSSILYNFQLLPHNVVTFSLLSLLFLLYFFFMAKSYGTANKKTARLKVFFSCSIYLYFFLVILSHNCRIRVKNCRWYRHEFPFFTYLTEIPLCRV